MVKQNSASRFSTLKVFNFAGSGSSGSKSQENNNGNGAGGSQPPPPPPKDRYFLYNKSMSSLSPESYTSSPTTPLTPSFMRPSPGPSHSTVDLPGEFGSAALAAPSISGHRSISGSSVEGSGGASTRAVKGFFGKIASVSKSRRTPRVVVKSPLVEDDAQIEPTEDDGISMPWNFQHNIHVDEGYTGLPPSWSTSLQAAGFSEDEISAIQARRSNGSPAAPYLYTGRPDSPASVLANPPPRTTSVRQMSDAASVASSRYRPPTAATTSTTSSFSSSRPGVPPPLQPIVPRPTRKPSNRSIYSDAASFDSGHPDAQYVYVNSHFELTSHAPSDSSHVSTDRSQSPSATTPNTSTSPPIILTPIANGDNTRPRTPPRRTFRVTNHSPGSSSPPPAYKSPGQNSAFAQVAARGEKSTPASGSQQHLQQARLEMEEDGEDEEDEEHVNSEPSTSTANQEFAKKLATMPPRLSLHEASGDLDSWSAGLFSAIPSAKDSLLSPTSASSSSKAPPSARSIPTSSSSSRFASTSTPPASSSSSRLEASVPPPTSSSSTSSRQPSTRRAPQRPIPSTPLGNVEEERQTQVLQIPEPPAITNSIGGDVHAHQGPSTPLYNEIMELVQQTSPRLSPIPMPSSKPPTPILPTSGDDARGVKGTTDGPHSRESDGYLSTVRERRDSNRDSNMSNVSTVTVTDTTIVRGASLATRAVANVISSTTTKKRDVDVQQVRSTTPPDAEYEEEEDDEDEDEDDEEELVFPPTPSPLRSTFPTEDPTPKKPSRHYRAASIASESRALTPSLTPPLPPALGSPSSSYFSESPSSSSGCDSQSRSGSSRPNSVGVSSVGLSEKPLALPPKDPSAYLRTSPGISPLPSPARSTFSESSIRETFGAHKVERSSAIPEDPDTTLKSKPSIKINGVQIDEPSRSNKPTTTTPAKRYLGWLSDVVAPLEEFIDGATDPRDHYIELQEIAEAESGSVYAARLVKPEALGLPLDVAFVAIKNVPILPSGSPKLLDLKKELTLVRGVTHKNILTMDALYVDLVEDSLWIRMELMERSLADVVGLVAEGLMVQERMIARFASDVLQALEYLQKQHIAHRDVRSDNLLLNSNGFLKLADFSNAVQVTPENSDCSGAAGVIYWQAPEMRTGGTYHALKVDVWSLGATVWETAQSEPPFTDIQDPRQFGDRWPSLTHPEIYSRSFHDFLRLCSEPAATRPDPSDLLNTPFIRNACGRPVNVHLLSQCRAIEETMLERENDS